MQQRNFILFIVLSAAILVGWWYVQNAIWPYKPPEEKKQVEQPVPVKKLPESVRADLYFHLSGTLAPEQVGLLTAARLAQRVAASEKRAQDTYWQNLSTKDRVDLSHATLALRSLAPLPLDPNLLDKLAVQLASAATPKSDGYKLDTITLGERGPEYYLQAKITTRGGGIQKLILPQFQAADEEGRPVVGDKGEKVPLHLIQDDPFYASFLMYHYADPKNDNSVLSDLGNLFWKVESQDLAGKVQQVVLSCDRIPGYDKLKIVKRFTLAPREYHVGLTIEIIDERDEKSEKQEPRSFRYQMAGSHGLPVEGTYYANPYRTPLIGLVNPRGYLERNLDETQHRISHRKGGEKVTAGDNYLQYAGVSNQYFASAIVVDDEQAPRSTGGVEKQNIVNYLRPTLESEELKGRVASLDLDKKLIHVNVFSTFEDKDKQKYKGMEGTQVVFRLLPHVITQLRQRHLEEGTDVLVSYYETLHEGRRIFVATEVHKGTVQRPQFDDFTIRVVSTSSPELKPRDKIVHKFLLYHGPSKVKLLGDFTGEKAVDPDLVKRYAETLHLATFTDYRSPGWMGDISNAIYWSSLLIWCTGLMHWLLDKLHYIVPFQSYGLTIILLTVLVRGMMFPISRKQAYLSLKMQELGPEVKKVQEKYKDDPTKRNAAVMELYRKHNVNPLGSCLPLLLQMPFFLGLYYSLQESVHFRLAEFLWIKNLAAPDMLIRWGESIPFISDPDYYGYFFYLGPYFNLLPLIAVALMLVQQKMLTPPPADEQQEMQQKMMKYMMIVIGIMFYKVAAGLCIYFIASSLWGLAERKLLPKKKTLAVAGAGPASPPSGDGPGGGNKPVGGNKPGGGGNKPGGRGKQRPAKKEKAPDTAGQKVKGWWQELLKQAKKK